MKGMQKKKKKKKKKILDACEGWPEKSVPWDYSLASLSKPHDVKHWSSHPSKILIIHAFPTHAWVPVCACVVFTCPRIHLRLQALS